LSGGEAVVSDTVWGKLRKRNLLMRRGSSTPIRAATA
jgi:hypothetical protein